MTSFCRSPFGAAVAWRLRRLFGLKRRGSSTNHPTDLNLEHGKFFKTAAEIRSAFRPVTRNVEPSRLVHMCGSGVTACQNQFAMELAGIKDSRVYIGSWSEWIRDPGRPVVQGAR